MRFPYTFAVPKFGGRNWTVISVRSIVHPDAMPLAYFDEPAGYASLLLMATRLRRPLSRFRWRKLSSSMANISFFFPGQHSGLGGPV